MINDNIAKKEAEALLRQFLAMRVGESVEMTFNDKPYVALKERYDGNGVIIVYETDQRGLRQKGVGLVHCEEDGINLKVDDWQALVKKLFNLSFE